MDEATSALDEPSEGRLYSTLIRECPDSAIVSVGHRSSLVPFHEMKLFIMDEGRWKVEGIAAAGKN